MIKKSRSFSELQKISSKIGNDINVIQGAGGNTSLKENGVLWVKASGCWLSDAIERNIFVPIDNDKVLRAIEIGEVSNISVKGGRSLDGLSLRPSIETTLHALMPHKYVLHVHAVNTLSNAVLSKGEECIQRVLFDINWAWVPYAMPGIQLSRAVQSSIEDKPDVLVLANHGLVVGGETAEQALKLLIKVEKKLKRTIRKTKKSDSNKLLSIINKSGYRLSKHKITHAIAMDRLALKIVKTGTLYPDHVVFLGPGPMKVISIAEFENVLKDPLYVNNNSVIIVRDFGVVVPRDFSDNAESMLYCLASVLLRIQEGEELRYLTQEDEMELMDWDAEKYRQSIQR
jgi:rhamnose utilization protein RhaD (predicted bifunctional aldolase and dehydrogenase)